MMAEIKRKSQLSKARLKKIELPKLENGIEDLKLGCCLGFLGIGILQYVVQAFAGKALTSVYLFVKIKHKCYSVTLTWYRGTNIQNADLI